MKKITIPELHIFHGQFKKWQREEVAYNGWYDFVEDFIAWLILDEQRTQDVCGRWINFKGLHHCDYIDNPHIQMENVWNFLREQNKAFDRICYDIVN